MKTTSTGRLTESLLPVVVAQRLDEFAEVAQDDVERLLVELVQGIHGPVGIQLPRDPVERRQQGAAVFQAAWKSQLKSRTTMRWCTRS